MKLNRYMFPLLASGALIGQACQQPAKQEAANDSSMVKLITLDPGHFHAALVQKSMSAGIDSNVHVYAPDGQELNAHLALIKQYNERAENPTNWTEQVYTGADYFEKMLEQKPGNVVVLAGNNRLKTDYIQKSIGAGLNVLSDKPMAITPEAFPQLEAAFKTAADKKVLLYDIMTERSEITNMLQKEFSHIPAVFGDLQKGSKDAPAVTIESVHYYYKNVSGKTLVRPSWFFDASQQGDAIADVGVHLIDLVQWACFPETAIDHTKDIEVLAARNWPTPLTKSQYTSITRQDSFPSFLQPLVKDTVLNARGNGEVTYSIKGVFVKVIARWDYKATEGGDTHYALMKGSLANLEIKQGKEEQFKPTLYIRPAKSGTAYEAALQQSVQELAAKYPGVTVEKAGKDYKVVIPEKYKDGHEAHFAQVLQRYLQYLKDGRLPDWEVPCMLSKYYTSTAALKLAGK
ncbi:putative oxidoreductase C-terminal domain-containing protein [uncultured Chitinophaga sp.]|uniref:putative oxidoreductase C-terminal domain-containing protein n=1 Tax=uncultured Chitinophaga sp. TaxID=339340 RepID=UPI0025EF41A6|nr:putative oxidoreductase C-terminal domain-containing protein [uncultured Chitinophaga sp.]